MTKEYLTALGQSHINPFYFLLDTSRNSHLTRISPGVLVKSSNGFGSANPSRPGTGAQTNVWS